MIKKEKMGLSSMERLHKCGNMFDDSSVSLIKEPVSQPPKLQDDDDDGPIYLLKLHPILRFLELP